MGGAFWSPDGQRLVTTNGTDNLLAWEPSSGKQSVLPLDGYVQVSSFAWSPDGSQLATSAYASPIYIWDTAAASSRLAKKFGLGDGLHIAWSPDGRQVASARDWQVYIWDAQTGSLVRSLTGTGKYIWDLAWSPDGRFFAFLSGCTVRGQAGYDCIASIWDAQRWSMLQTFPVSGADYYLAWLPDAKILATAGERISLWERTSGKQLRSFGQGTLGNAEGLAWSPDGTRLVTNGGALWDATTGSILVQVKGEDPYGVTSAALSPDGKILAAVERTSAYTTPRTGNSCRP